ncbi:MAG: hypothetical protein CL920_34655 [Deltaproteobacteria bacterium]|nr:hypothetical protein [Deltaproteobacteria bacterium]MBU53865.1 hypothetical protein [Deltaproteobacteria bacterium]|tara:strand:- start:4299 stop:4988 length:690 start_codon:yes stop_codon:yes gene_type:complete
MQYMIWLVPASYLMAAIWAGGVKNSKFFWGLPAFHLLLWAALAVSNGTWLQCEGDLWGAQAVSCAFVALLLARGRSALLVVPFVLSAFCSLIWGFAQQKLSVQSTQHWFDVLFALGLGASLVSGAFAWRLLLSTQEASAKDHEAWRQSVALVLLLLSFAFGFQLWLGWKLGPMQWGVIAFFVGHIALFFAPHASTVSGEWRPHRMLYLWGGVLFFGVWSWNFLSAIFGA